MVVFAWVDLAHRIRGQVRGSGDVSPAVGSRAEALARDVAAKSPGAQKRKNFCKSQYENFKPGEKKSSKFH